MKDGSLLESFLLYIKKPSMEIKPSKRGFLYNTADVLRFWSLGLLVSAIAGIFASSFLEGVGVDNSQNILNDLFVTYPIWLIIFIVFFIGPILEELTFRLGLRFSPFKFGFALSMMVFMLAETLVGLSQTAGQWMGERLENLGILDFLIIVFALVFFLAFVISIVVKKTKLEGHISRFYQKYFSVIFYTSTIVFAVAHVFNFENYQEIWFALPLLVAPQLVLGFILAYVRMAYNTAWAIFYHILHNSLISIPVLFFAQIPQKTFDMITEAESLDALNLSPADTFYLSGGMLSALLIFLLFVFSFGFLVRNYMKVNGYRFF